MASTHEELEMRESFSTTSMGILPGMEERFSFKTLFYPNNSEPSGLSGSAVNVCASLLGRMVGIITFFIIFSIALHYILVYLQYVIFCSS